MTELTQALNGFVCDNLKMLETGKELAHSGEVHHLPRTLRFNFGGSTLVITTLSLSVVGISIFLHASIFMYEVNGHLL